MKLHILLMLELISETTNLFVIFLTWTDYWTWLLSCNSQSSNLSIYYFYWKTVFFRNDLQIDSLEVTCIITFYARYINILSCIFLFFFLLIATLKLFLLVEMPALVVRDHTRLAAWCLCPRLYRLKIFGPVLFFLFFYL